MREIPSLQLLCLRSVGSHSCSAEDTFASSSGGNADSTTTTTTTTAAANQPSTASRLLQSVHRRPTCRPNTAIVINKKQQEQNNNQSCAIESIPMARTPCIGIGSARRLQANDVDLFHPFVGCRLKDAAAKEGEASKEHYETSAPVLVQQHGNAALDCLQSYIDSLVELGRMDDGRLGRHFFDEWRNNVIIAANGSAREDRGVKRKRNTSPKSTSTSRSTPLGSLSLYNCTIGEETFEHMVQAKIGPYLANLDLSGVRGLTDDLMEPLLTQCSNLQCLSLKNCRRITSKTLESVGRYQKKLQLLDIGGATNLTTQHVLDLVPNVPALDEIHVSGLGWTDESLGQLVELRQWKSMSCSFSLTLTHRGLRQNLLHVASTLRSLALAFCESVIDNAAMGLLGRNLPHVVSLDVRGNPQLSTLTGWYDGRVSADLPVQELTVLARYSGLSEASIDETKRVHPLEATKLIVILDGGGMGVGITRTEVIEDEGGADGTTEESQ